MRKADKDNRESGNIQNNGDKIIVKFPIQIGTAICYACVFVCIVIATVFGIIYIRELFTRIKTSHSILIIVCYIVIVLFNLTSFVIIFIRKVIIDKGKKLITYVSFRKKTFDIRLITKMENIVDSSPDGPNDYILVVWFNEKKVKIRTQSDEQSQQLKNIINSLAA